MQLMECEMERAPTEKSCVEWPPVGLGDARQRSRKVVCPRPWQKLQEQN